MLQFFRKEVASCMLQESTRKRFEKGQFERRARMEKDDLENLLFRLFERQVCSTSQAVFKFCFVSVELQGDPCRMLW
jgi:hypothetical protein